MMRNMPIYLAALAAAAVSTSSCKEVHPDYFEDISSVYFNNRGTGNVLIDTTDVTFVYEPLDAVRMEVPVTVQLLGRASSLDREVSISVSSDNAEEGTDYILPESAVLPAGEYSFDYVVTLLRTAELQTSRKEVRLSSSTSLILLPHTTTTLSETGELTSNDSSMTSCFWQQAPATASARM